MDYAFSIADWINYRFGQFGTLNKKAVYSVQLFVSIVVCRINSANCTQSTIIMNISNTMGYDDQDWRFYINAGLEFTLPRNYYLVVFWISLISTSIKPNRLKK